MSKNAPKHRTHKTTKDILLDLLPYAIMITGVIIACIPGKVY